MLAALTITINEYIFLNLILLSELIIIWGQGNSVMTEWSRSEKVVNIVKSASSTVGGCLDSLIFTCYARVIRT